MWRQLAKTRPPYNWEFINFPRLQNVFKTLAGSMYFYAVNIYAHNTNMNHKASTVKVVKAKNAIYFLQCCVVL